MYGTSCGQQTPRNISASVIMLQALNTAAQFAMSRDTCQVVHVCSEAHGVSKHSSVQLEWCAVPVVTAPWNLLRF